MRRLIPACLASAVIVLGLALASPAWGQSGGGCQLKGSANLSPGLSNNDQNFTYDFGGDLSGCQSNQAGAPASGTRNDPHALAAAVPSDGPTHSPAMPQAPPPER